MEGELIQALKEVGSDLWPEMIGRVVMIAWLWFGIWSLTFLGSFIGWKRLCGKSLEWDDTQAGVAARVIGAIVLGLLGFIWLIVACDLVVVLTNPNAAALRMLVR